MGRNCSIPDIIPYNRVETERDMTKLEISIHTHEVYKDSRNVRKHIRDYCFESCNISNMAERQSRPQQLNSRKLSRLLTWYKVSNKCVYVD